METPWVVDVLNVFTEKRGFLVPGEITKIPKGSKVSEGMRIS